MLRVQGGTYCRWPKKHPKAVVVVCLLIISLVMVICIAVARDIKSIQNRPYDGECKPHGAHTGRLSTQAVPVNYSVTLNIDLHNTTFEGYVEITVRLMCPSRYLTLHASSLNILRVTLLGSDCAVNVSSIGDELITLDLCQTIRGPTVTVAFDYTAAGGCLGQERGVIFSGYTYISYNLSRGSCVRNNDELFVYAVMAPNLARTVLPCFDEPSMKALFSLQLNYSKDFLAFSNMPTEKRSIQYERNLTAHRFLPTKRISTYLITFAVGNFVRRRKYMHGIEIGMITPAAINESMVQTAFSTTKESLQFFLVKQNFTYKFSNKIDMIDVGKVRFNALECAGLVLYKTPLLYYKPSDISFSDYQYTISREVIHHELAHTWFGNLVTFAWWDDLWLSEGLTTFYQDKALAATYPLEEHAISTYNTNFEMTFNLRNRYNRAIVSNLKPKMIRNGDLFNSLVYQGAASVVTMLEAMVGDEQFRDFIERYLKKYAYGSLATQEFVDLLSEVFNSTVAAVMNSFLRNEGVPVLKMTMETDFGGFSKLVLSQYAMKSRYDTSITPTSKRPRQLWNIPLFPNFQIESHPGSLGTDGAILVKSEGVVYLKNVDPNFCPEINFDRKGYYRVEYDVNIWTCILKKQLPKGRRLVGLVADAFALGRLGVLSYAEILQVLPRLMKEDVPSPATWTILKSGLMEIAAKLMRTTYYAEFQKMVITILTSVYGSWQKIILRQSDKMNSVYWRRGYYNFISLVCAFHENLCNKTIDAEKDATYSNMRDVERRYFLVKYAYAWNGLNMSTSTNANETIGLSRAFIRHLRRLVQLQVDGNQLVLEGVLTLTDRPTLQRIAKTGNMIPRWSRNGYHIVNPIVQEIMTGENNLLKHIWYTNGAMFLCTNNDVKLVKGLLKHPEVINMPIRKWRVLQILKTVRQNNRWLKKNANEINDYAKIFNTQLSP